MYTKKSEIKVVKLWSLCQSSFLRLWVPMTITITAFCTLHSFTVRTNFLSPRYGHIYNYTNTFNLIKHNIEFQRCFTPYCQYNFVCQSR